MRRRERGFGWRGAGAGFGVVCCTLAAEVGDEANAALDCCASSSGLEISGERGVDCFVITGGRVSCGLGMGLAIDVSGTEALRGTEGSCEGKV